MKNKNPKYAFYYLLSLVSLIFMAVSVAMIVFRIIDKSIFDILSADNYLGEGQLRFGISALFISVPIFYLINNIINKGLRKGDLDKDSSIRRWLTYFILFISAVIILGSLVGVINNFLSGEITLKFVLKILTVILISAIVFSFYLYDIKREKVNKKDRMMRIFSISSLALVIIVFISAWFFVESPKLARERKLDNALLNNLYGVESYINDYYGKKKELPENLMILKQELNIDFNNKIFIDLETGKEIEYHKIGVKDFELCANFRTDSYESDKNRAYPIYYNESNKVYIKGWNCFRGNLWSGDTVKY